VVVKTRRSLSLEIGHLVLHGVPASQARAFAAGLERELTRLLAQPSAAPALAAAPPERARLDAGSFRAGHPEGLARVIYGQVLGQVVARGAPPQGGGK
jgi:hypothetical protein